VELMPSMKRYCSWEDNLHIIAMKDNWGPSVCDAGGIRLGLCQTRQS
jgi:hypothetical protein